MPKKQKKIVSGKIISNQQVSADHFIIEIESPWLGSNSLPGQFVSLRLTENSTDPLLRIPMGLHDMWDTGISLLYKVIGKGTELLSSKKKDENIDVLGPLGNSFDLSGISSENNSLTILVGGGHGVGPLHSVTKTIADRDAELWVFTGAGTKRHVLCAGEMEDHGAKVFVSTDDGTAGYKGLITDLLVKELKDKPEDVKRARILGCGPAPMLAAVAQIAKKFDIPAQVSIDTYMACGIGACLGCAVMTVDGYKMVCKDGPVFDAEKIDWGSFGS